MAHLSLKKQRDKLLEQQQEFDRSHRRNLMILNTASEGIFGIDKEHNITFINPAALQMIGYKEDEVLGKNSCSIMHHTKPDGGKRSPAECLTHQTILTGKTLETCQDIYWRQNHTSFPVTFSAAPAFEKGAIVGAVIVFKDISKRLQLEEELYKADKVEAFEVLAGGISHDFNNLLTVVSGNLDLALWLEEADGELKEHLLSCKEAVTMAIDLAAKFFIIARSGKSSTSIVDIKEAVYKVIAALPGNRHIDYEVTLPDELWPLEADEVQLLQLLKNIISNAQEAMPDGGLVIIKGTNCLDCAQKHTSLAKGRYLQLSIRDQGIGIHDEQKKKIFDPYFSSKVRGIKKGMGLGLSICNAIMQKHDGLLDLETETQKGTTVHLYFPVADEDALQNL